MFHIDLNDSVLQLVQRNCDQTAFIMCFCYELSEATKKGTVNAETNNHFFDNLVQSASSSLCLKEYHDTDKKPEPHWSDSLRSKIEDDTKHLHLIAFYCQCLSRQHGSAAEIILNCLKQEIVTATAGTKMFKLFLIPFIKDVPKALKQFEIIIPSELQKTCQQIMETLFQRFVGPEPTEPSDFKRKPRGCGKSDCASCARLDDFLRDPGKESVVMADEKCTTDYWGYYTRERVRAHEYVRNHEDKTVKITKKNDEWKDGHKEWKDGHKEWKDGHKEWKDGHKEWKDRLEGVLKELGNMEECRELLGARYDELVSMRGTPA